MLLFDKTLTEVTRIGFPLHGNASLPCADFSHQKEPKFCLKHDVRKGLLICKDSPVKDSWVCILFYRWV